MRGVIDECYKTLHGRIVQAPLHVKEMLVAAHEQQRKVEMLISQVTRVHENENEETGEVGDFAATKEKELASELAILRDKVGLLRDAYSE